MVDSNSFFNLQSLKTAALTAAFFIVVTWGAACAPASLRSPASTARLTPALWQVQVPGSGPGQHRASTVFEREDIYLQGSLFGLTATLIPSREITVPFQIPDDMGDGGSFALSAEVDQMPANLTGQAYAILTALIAPDGQDWVKLSRQGTGEDCGQSGLYLCPATSCSGNQCVCLENQNCRVGPGSAYFNREHWAQRQIPGLGYASVNVFPTCAWNSGQPTCPFNAGFFQNQKLPAGRYEAKYVLLAAEYPDLVFQEARLHVSVMRKKTPATLTSANGAVDINFILVGTKNAEDARTQRGQQNINQLFTLVQNTLDQFGLGVRLGSIRAFDWNDGQGDGYAHIPIEQVGELFSIGSRGAPADTEGKAINIFMVSTLPFAQANVTVLGVAGAIPGALIHGTGSSGLAFSSFEQLATFNPQFPQLEESFMDFASTVSHEIGHYLGLNHPNEMDGTTSDYTGDTPRCGVNTQGIVTHSSCLSAATCSPFCQGYNGISQFCPTIVGCQFNHTMWYTTKFFNPTVPVGDGSLFSTQSSRILLTSPFVR